MHDITVHSFLTYNIDALCQCATCNISSVLLTEIVAQPTIQWFVSTRIRAGQFRKHQIWL